MATKHSYSKVSAKAELSNPKLKSTCTGVPDPRLNTTFSSTSRVQCMKTRGSYRPWIISSPYWALKLRLEISTNSEWKFHWTWRVDTNPQQQRQIPSPENDCEIIRSHGVSGLRKVKIDHQHHICHLISQWSDKYLQMRDPKKKFIYVISFSPPGLKLCMTAVSSRKSHIFKSWMSESFCRFGLTV